MSSQQQCVSSVKSSFMFQTIDSLDAISRNLEKIVSTLEETDRNLGQQMKR